MKRRIKIVTLDGRWATYKNVVGITTTDNFLCLTLANTAEYSFAIPDIKRIENEPIS